jgi:hypothetical protein
MEIRDGKILGHEQQILFHQPMYYWIIAFDLDVPIKDT